MAKSVALENSRDSISKAKGPLGWYQRTRAFLAQVQNEMSRVTWPSVKEVQATTFVVVLFSVMAGLYLWISDLLLDRLARFLYTSFGA